MAETLRDANDINQITDLLSKFWRTEAIGIQEVHSVTKQNREGFLKKIKYKDTHYEVPLPWKHYCSDLSDHFNFSYS